MGGEGKLTDLGVVGGESRMVGTSPFPFAESKSRVRARITEFAYPPVHDALVLGVKAPQGTEAFKKGLGLLVPTPFEHVDINDGVIGSVLVRSSVLRRISRENFVDFIVRRVRPLMGVEEILHLDLNIEIELDDDPR